jgi:hypothetical protein
MPLGAFPALLERLRGTPLRAAEMVAGVADERLRYRPGGAWSAKRHMGHLDDIHVLDEKRLREFLAGAAKLTAADPANRLTYETDHDNTPVGEIISRLRTHRLSLVAEMAHLTPTQITATATHPRLGQPLRLIDWLFFVAEHDDHHLAAARQALTKSVLANE